MKQDAKQHWRIKRGIEGERLALEYLRNKGFRLLSQNYRFERGEIDLVMEDRSELVFVEVKTRRSLKYGEPEQAVSVKKQNQMKKVAEGYLQDHDIETRSWRFDVVAISITTDTPHIVHYEHAFS